MDDRRVITDHRLPEIATLGDGSVEREPRYAGLRMTADEYEELPDDGCKYELIDGVVVMSPSPSFGHQDVAGEIEWQIRTFLKDHPVGSVAHETDAIFDPLRVYRPDLMFLSTRRFPVPTDRVRAIPDMVLEVLSPGTRAMDLSTKRDDYQRFGVSEYWIADPAAATMTFLRLTSAGAKGAAVGRGGGKMVYRPVPCKGTKFPSIAIPGFTLNISPVKKLMAGKKKSI